MNDHTPHRKTIRHFESQREAHFLTFSCVDRRSLLTRNDLCEMLVTSITRALDTCRYELFAFVIMPEHVHLLVYPRADAAPISRLIRAIKQPMSFRVKRTLERTSDPSLRSLLHTTPTGQQEFHFWQQGPWYDSNLRSWESIHHTIQYIHLNPVRRGLVDQPEMYRWSSCRQCLFPDHPAEPNFPAIRRSK